MQQLIVCVGSVMPGLHNEELVLLMNISAKLENVDAEHAVSVKCSFTV